MKCPRCNKVHTCPPLDINKVLNENSKDISEYINREVIKTLKE
ncbi:hypothetical protein UFOVP58_186 [uncultured Caudovirales phage]|uniref:Uncharacterized protein n=1 Tax=uncultured Caudovirales phage TaxID=2100421 RepID=A0A6J5KSZ0_9CAUD|nr:hypothetical protein UFOVP58_186 [uncultured Caudovirales phage]